MKYSQIVSETPQSEALNERQVENNAGGYVFKVDQWVRLERFLILGSDAATYYQSARKLTKENAAVVVDCWAQDPHRTMSIIATISSAGRAPKNDPAIFALAIGASHESAEARSIALHAVPDNSVLRTATHLFQFVNACRALGRGWGRAMKRAVSEWYGARSVDKVAYQAIKYRSRDGYTHKRLIQSSHPDHAHSEARIALYRWMCGKDFDRTVVPAVVRAHLTAMEDASKGEIISLVAEDGLPWEALPTEVTKDPDIWSAMLPKMGMTALIRNLGAMTSYGVLEPLSDNISVVCRRLEDPNAIKASRVHPMQVLNALATYRSGCGAKGSLSWTPSAPVVDALDKAFYAAFDNVEATGARTLIALDISGSMETPIPGSQLSAREASAAMAMVSLRAEDKVHTVGFSSAENRNFGTTKLVNLPMSKGQRLDDAVRAVSGLPFGRTDCALPMIYALENDLSVDAFYIYTDNETWAGSVHPMEALRRYRKHSGINAKLVVVGMTSTGFSIADPQSGRAMDVVGFDVSAPAVMADFISQQ